MKINSKIVFALALVLVLGWFIFNLSNRQNLAEENLKTKPSITSALNSFETKSDDQAEVTVEVTPQTLGGDENVFLVNFNTHSVELDFDFRQIITLKDNLGNAYQATEWTGGRGGHHTNGEIIFPKVKEGVNTLILTISQVGSVERSFSWEVKNG